MNQNLTHIIELESTFSTTRRVIKADPKEIAGLVKQANKPEGKFETQLLLSDGEGRQGEGGLRTKGFFKIGGIVPEFLYSSSQGEGSKEFISYSDIASEVKSSSNSLFNIQNSSLDSSSLITIVTVVYNGEKFLEETILSVINQTYDNVEYIIIDGGSTDGTLDIIRKYEHAIDYWVSEKDKGIYDAMNKGIDLATGRWINFMNGGDGFYQLNVLADVFAEKQYDEKILFGDVVADYGEFQKVLEANTSLSELWKGMCFSHQSTFFQSEYHKKNKYNTAYKLSGDFDVIYRAYLKGQSFHYLDKVISTVEVGGLSYVHREKVFNEYRKVSCGESLSMKCFYFTNLIFLYKIKKIIKRLLGRRLVNFVLRLY